MLKNSRHGRRVAVRDSAREKKDRDVVVGLVVVVAVAVAVAAAAP